MMQLDIQDLINLIIGLVGVAFGWVLTNMWDAIKTLQKDDKGLAKELAEVQALVKGQYVHSNELKDYMQRVFAKLDKIESQVNQNSVQAATIEERVSLLINEHDARTRGNG